MGICPNCSEPTLRGEYVHIECEAEYMAYISGDTNPNDQEEEPVVTLREQVDALEVDDLITVTTEMGERFTGRLAWSARRDRDLAVRADGGIVRTPIWSVTGVERVACEHGHPARNVLLVDQTRKNASDPYGDVEGPVSVEMLGAMLRLRDAHTNSGRGRYVLAFIHTDRCRTEQPATA